MNNLCVVALDLSYASTGMCALWGDSSVTLALRFKGSLEHPGERLAWLADGIGAFMEEHKPSAVFAERPFTPRPGMGDPSMGIKLGMLHGFPIAVSFRLGAQFRHVEPATYRAAVLGFVPRGEKVKKQVAERLRLIGLHFHTDDEADAYCIARYGMDLLRAHNGVLPPVETKASRKRVNTRALRKMTTAPSRGVAK